MKRYNKIFTKMRGVLTSVRYCTCDEKQEIDRREPRTTESNNYIYIKKTSAKDFTFSPASIH